jgi:diguanylate cyclase (GGDEF)-like protein
MLSKAIETNKQRELTYVRQATIDALTGCKNRRAFDSDIAALMNDHQPFALALVDIDNFKSINDTWGHLNGDIVLRNVAREGLQVLQPLEISLYRYGGEEFAVVFPAEHIDNARTLLETWRVNVERRTWREDGLTVTFSAGLGEWNMEPLDKLVVSVDEALYKAKQQGKNRILRARLQRRNRPLRWAFLFFPAKMKPVSILCDDLHTITVKRLSHRQGRDKDKTSRNTRATDYEEYRFVLCRRYVHQHAGSAYARCRAEERC